MSRSQVGIKWVKSLPQLHYFEKKSNNQWKEYQNGKEFANFTEILFQYPVVILKKQDGIFVKLTQNSGYWSHDPNSISKYFTDGKWEDYTQPTQDQSTCSLNSDRKLTDQNKSENTPQPKKEQSPRYLHSDKQTLVSSQKSNFSSDQTNQNELNKAVEELYSNVLRLTKDLKFDNAFEESIKGLSLKSDHSKLKTAKSTLEKLNETQTKYQSLNANGNQLLFNNNYEQAKDKFKQALDTYNSITQDSNVLSFFNLAELNLIDYIRRGKKHYEDMISLINEQNTYNINLNQNKDIDHRRSQELYETALRNIGTLKFSDALNELKNAFKLDPADEKIKSTILQLEDLIKNESNINKLIAEGNRESLNKNFDLAKEKYRQASDAYLRLTSHPKLVGFFRETQLDLYAYIKNGINQVDQLISLFQNDFKIDSRADDLKKDAFRAIRDLNYENALEMFNMIASLKNPDYNFDKEVICLKKALSNLETNYKYIRDGNEFKKKKNWVEAVRAFKKASAVYSEITLDATFIKLHNGDLNEYISKNKADEYLKDAENNLMDNEAGNNADWDDLPVIDKSKKTF